MIGQFKPEEFKGTIPAVRSREALSANNMKKLFEKKNADIESADKSESAVRSFLEANPRVLVPGTSIEDVIKELKNDGFIPVFEEAPKDKKDKKKNKKKDNEVIMFNAWAEAVTIVKDENLKKIAEENMSAEALEDQKDIFKNDEDLDLVYVRALGLGKGMYEEIIETDEDYYEFADLVKGGREEVDKDLGELRDIERRIREDEALLDASVIKKNTKNYKVAMIVERAVEHSFTDLEWYGNSISIEPTPRFTDVRRGIDGVFQIRKEGGDHFLGLGIDVTYRGLLSNQYKEKLFKLLGSIKDGYQAKVKYFKNYQGERMSEFAVPKTVLSFDVKDVKDLVFMIKNLDNAEVVESFKNNPMKTRVMNQMLVQCELLAQFAEEFKNPIAVKYREVISAIQDATESNPELKKVLDTKHEDNVAKHVKYLIGEFKSRPQVLK